MSDVLYCNVFLFSTVLLIRASSSTSKFAIIHGVDVEPVRQECQLFSLSMKVMLLNICYCHVLLCDCIMSLFYGLCNDVGFVLCLLYLCFDTAVSQEELFHRSIQIGLQATSLLVCQRSR